MSKPQNLGTSDALGLWTKYAHVMDEIYEYYDADNEPENDDAPPYVKQLWEENQHNLIKVFAAAERDRDALLAACLGVVETVFAHEGPFQLKRRRNRDEWEATFYATPTDDKAGKGPIWITLGFETTGHAEWVLYANLWVAGGKRVTNELRESLDQVKDSQDFPGNWASGGVFLSRVHFSQCLAPDRFAIDLDRVLLEITRDLRRQTPTRLRNLIGRLRNFR